MTLFQAASATLTDLCDPGGTVTPTTTIMSSAKKKDTGSNSRTKKLRGNIDTDAEQRVSNAKILWLLTRDPARVHSTDTGTSDPAGFVPNLKEGEHHNRDHPTGFWKYALNLVLQFSLLNQGVKPEEEEEFDEDGNAVVPPPRKQSKKAKTQMYISSISVLPVSEVLGNLSNTADRRYFNWVAHQIASYIVEKTKSGWPP